MGEWIYDKSLYGGKMIMDYTPESLRTEAIHRGVRSVGTPERRPDLEPNHLYVIYVDEFGNEYVIRRGILTIVSGYGEVF